MVRELPFTAGLTALTVFVLVHQTCSTQNSIHQCAPSSCGNIQNISYPFRLKSDPQTCGDPRYELSCESNHTVLLLYAEKYNVQEINYSNYTIRVVDSGIYKDNYFSTPSYSSDQFFISQRSSQQIAPFYILSNYNVMVFMSCERPVNTPFYLDTSTCIDNGDYSSNSSISHSKRYKYVTIDARVMDVKDSCRLEQMVLTSRPGNDHPNISCSEIHNDLVYGFELSWIQVICDRYCGGNSCYRNDLNRVQCDSKIGLGRRLLYFFEEWLVTLYYFFKGRQPPYVDYLSIAYNWYLLLNIVLLYLTAKMVLGAPCVVALLIYKWCRRHLSTNDAVEEFLQSQNNFMPIRYSYLEIRKMTKGFKDKLGEGGYGSVYKGKLQSGRLVAIKMLDNFKANGQDFINEVATIGRIHHMNVVQLIGFCAKGPKRALIYEFMLNGSLDKYIFSLEERIPLSIEKIYEISLGVAHGIEYLHRGCDIQILHFDIKPHNILLDENFTPKVSDFGLAKLFLADDSIVSLTAARGTLGYMAPELFYKNIGGVSYKADVYSFGMLLLEMASRRKNFNALADHSSQIYFPTWVYDQVSEGNDIIMEDVTEEEKKTINKMIIVALWCIQMKPSDRCSMNKVVEMLVGEVECLQMPSKPFLSSLADVGDNLNPTCSTMQSGESSQSTQF
ncbi:LEAF RUST 10 DISEASE-RESISTANCE LOCUS RECEPTOR-LIKE PROTEIN KINASE-like 2.3 [Castanea sativa]|uniref:LEAF RUST 10 DISEASE-RESISTANCE LOCUS RECEPTOR-LIKE PROTEIN KINASE-like 2.3 n=1 Tax=Castanea sativa TaxID=21020 RepID=UPI003F650FAC